MALAPFPSWSRDVFRHEALLYSGTREFVAATSAFIRNAVDAKQPILVVVAAPKIQALRDGLGDIGTGVEFADMAVVGQNPARLIPMWRSFVTSVGEAGRPFRGIGEPVWPDRTADELVECQRHEALLNLAFDDKLPWWLLCPYDTSTLPQLVIDAACESHPLIRDGQGSEPSGRYPGHDQVIKWFDRELPDPPAEAVTFEFDAPDALAAVRDFVAEQATQLGLPSSRASELVLAVNEIATNSLRHGGGRGVLQMWSRGDGVVAQVRDRGWIRDPLVGRTLPEAERMGGRGLWLVNQLCDLVQIRSTPEGTVVRVYMCNAAGYPLAARVQRPMRRGRNSIA